MANFDKLEMTQELLSHKNLSVVSSLFGLSKKLIYTVTGSTVKAVKNNYNAEAVSHLMRVLESDAHGLASAVKACRAAKVEIGNIELDACISQDKQFVALQLLQFGDYMYRPISKVAFFEGADAELVSQIL